MTNIKKYSYSEILSFYSPCDPPQYFQSNCPIFTHESQKPVILTNSNPPFVARPFNFVPKKARSSDSSNESNQKPTQTSKIIDFRPQIIKEDKNENQLNNKSNDIENVDNTINLSNQSNRYRFRPETIEKPISSSAPPTSISDSKQNNTQIQAGNEILNFKPQKDVSNINQGEIRKDSNVNNKSEFQNAKNYSSNNPSIFRPQKEEKKFEAQQDNTKSNNQDKNENKKEVENKENIKTTPWTTISMKTDSVQVQSKKNEDFEKDNSMQVQLQKEIDNSLISTITNSSDDQQKNRSNVGFAPKKLDQTYEAPELPTEKPSKPKQNRKALTNFDEIEKEEMNQKNQTQNQQSQQQQQKKGLFESLIEQEKKNQNKSSKKDFEDDEAPKKPAAQKVGFAPKLSGHLFEGPSIDELNKPSNTKNTNTKEAKSGFSALMEQEKLSSEKEKKEKELEKEKQNTVKKPSIVDILIAETIQEKSKETPKTYEEDVPEEKPTFQAFKPIRANASYEAPSIEEIESYSKNQQKKTTFSEALSNQNQNQTKNKNSKPSFEELQKNESAKQAQSKKQGSFTNAPSFFDLLVKEEKKEKQIAQSAKNSNVDKDEEKSTQKATSGFNPKRSKPDAGSFSEMLDREKQKQKETQLKNNENNIPSTVKVNTRPGGKFTGNYPSFAQLINEEVRLEEQRSSPIPQITSAPMGGKNSSFQQKIEDEEYQVESSAIGDFVSVQGELPKKWLSKKNRGKKRGGRGGNVRADESSEFFWGVPSTSIDSNEKDDDQNSQNWPSMQGQDEDDESTDFGFGKAKAPQKKDARVSWLSKVLEEELGEEDPWEFAESLAHKSKPEMIRFLSTVTFDQQQASNIATRFFQTFPAK